MEKLFNESIKRLSDRVIQLESTRNRDHSKNIPPQQDALYNFPPAVPSSFNNGGGQSGGMQESRSTARLEPGRIRANNSLSNSNSNSQAKLKGRY